MYYNSTLQSKTIRLSREFRCKLPVLLSRLRSSQDRRFLRPLPPNVAVALQIPRNIIRSSKNQHYLKDRFRPVLSTLSFTYYEPAMVNIISIGTSQGLIVTLLFPPLSIPGIRNSLTLGPNIGKKTRLACKFNTENQVYKLYFSSLPYYHFPELLHN